MTGSDDSDSGESDDPDQLSGDSSSGNASELFLKGTTIPVVADPAADPEIAPQMDNNQYSNPNNDMKDDYKIFMYSNIRGLPPPNSEVGTDNGAEKKQDEYEEEAEFMNEITMNDFDHQRNDFIFMDQHKIGHESDDSEPQISKHRYSLDTAMIDVSEQDDDDDDDDDKDDYYFQILQ